MSPEGQLDTERFIQKLKNMERSTIDVQTGREIDRQTETQIIRKDGWMDGYTDGWMDV